MSETSSDPAPHHDWTDVDPYLVTNWLMDQVIALTKKVASLEGRSAFVSPTRSEGRPVSRGGGNSLERILTRQFSGFRSNRHINYHVHVVPHRSGFPPESFDHATKFGDGYIEDCRRQGLI